jgi:cobalt-zinc-cadmium resistance protein CzcA
MHAQKVININDAVQIATTNNPVVKNAGLKVEGAMASASSFPNFKPTEVSFNYGQIHSSIYTKTFEISQNLGSPFTQWQNMKLEKEKVQLSKSDQAITLKQFTALVKKAYMKLLFDNLLAKLTEQEALSCGDFENFYPETAVVPDSLMPEKASAQSLYADVQRRLYIEQEEARISTNQIQQMLGMSETPVLADSSMEIYAIEAFRQGTDKFQPYTYVDYYEQIQKVTNCQVNVERSKLTPEITAGYFVQDVNHISGFKGYMFGLSIPLIFNAQTAKIKEARINQKITANETEYQKLYLKKNIENLQIRLNQYFVNISYFRENALDEAETIIQSSVNQLIDKKITYSVYLGNIIKAYGIRSSYLTAIRLYNETAIEMEHYLN